MHKKEFPILEYDEDRNALIRPSQIFRPAGISERCVLCYFGEAIEKILEDFSYKTVSYFEAESIKIPIYELDYKDDKIVLLRAYSGAPGAAVQMEVLTALGCRKFIACGSCGVLQKDIAVGQLIIPTAAVRDEGTSYHYAEPAREITANERVVQIIENTLAENSVPCIKAKTWTTDAFYRETPAKIRQRISENCVTVDMEASAYIAVAQYNGVDFGQIFYAGDSLAGEEWDSRDWENQTNVRELVLRMALDACMAIE